MLHEGNYLVHFGIKGMRWGIRKYQNEDGTLTDEGRQHYAIDEGGNRRFKRLYNKEGRKLEYLANDADADAQAKKAARLRSEAMEYYRLGTAYRNKNESASNNFLYRARTKQLLARDAEYLTTEKGHKEAVAERNAQYKKLYNMVKNTSYASLFKDQVAAYKKEHPNTKLSDKQIIDALT